MAQPVLKGASETGGRIAAEGQQAGMVPGGGVNAKATSCISSVNDTCNCSCGACRPAAQIMAQPAPKGAEAGGLIASEGQQEM